MVLIDGFGYHPRSLRDLKPEDRISRRCLNGYHGAICVPAANLNRGSRFSGSLSGVEPWLPVTRRCLG